MSILFFKRVNLALSIVSFLLICFSLLRQETKFASAALPGPVINHSDTQSTMEGCENFLPATLPTGAQHFQVKNQMMQQQWITRGACVTEYVAGNLVWVCDDPVSSTFPQARDASGPAPASVHVLGSSVSSPYEFDYIGSIMKQTVTFTGNGGAWGMIALCIPGGICLGGGLYFGLSTVPLTNGEALDTFHFKFDPPQVASSGFYVNRMEIYTYLPMAVR